MNRSRPRRPGTRVLPALLLLSLALSVRADEPLDAVRSQVEALLEAETVEVLFPDPVNKAVERLRDPVDRVIHVHREWARAAHAASGGSYVQEKLAEALSQRHLEEAWRVTRRLRDAHRDGLDDPLGPLTRVLYAPALAADPAALVPVLERVPPELTGEAAPHLAAARAAAAGLEDPAILAAHVAALEAGEGELATRGRLRRTLSWLRKGLDGLLDRLTLRFGPETLVRFFDRLQRTRLADELGGAARRASRELLDRLEEEILDELDLHLQAGLKDRVRRIEIVEGGGLSISSSLYRGRLRLLLKFLGATDDSRDLRLFLPTLAAVHRGIRARRRQHREGPGARWLEEQDEALETSRTLLELKSRRPSKRPAEENLFRAIFEALRAEDHEGMFEALAGMPDLAD